MKRNAKHLELLWAKWILLLPASYPLPLFLQVTFSTSTYYIVLMPPPTNYLALKWFFSLEEASQKPNNRTREKQPLRNKLINYCWLFLVLSVVLVTSRYSRFLINWLFTKYFKSSSFPLKGATTVAKQGIKTFLEKYYYVWKCTVICSRE